MLFATLYSGLFFLSFIAIFVSVISASYYLKIIRVICFSSDENTIQNYENLSLLNSELNIESRYDYNLPLMINNYQSFVISFLTLFILLFIFKSSFILNSAILLAESTVFL